MRADFFKLVLCSLCLGQSCLTFAENDSGGVGSRGGGSLCRADDGSIVPCDLLYQGATELPYAESQRIDLDRDLPGVTQEISAFIGTIYHRTGGLLNFSEWLKSGVEFYSVDKFRCVDSDGKNANVVQQSGCAYFVQLLDRDNVSRSHDRLIVELDLKAVKARPLFYQGIILIHELLHLNPFLKAHVSPPPFVEYIELNRHRQYQTPPSFAEVGSPEAKCEEASLAAPGAKFQTLSQRNPLTHAIIELLLKEYAIVGALEREQSTGAKRLLNADELRAVEKFQMLLVYLGLPRDVLPWMGVHAFGGGVSIGYRRDYQFYACSKVSQVLGRSVVNPGTFVGVSASVIGMPVEDKFVNPGRDVVRETVDVPGKRVEAFGFTGLKSLSTEDTQLYTVSELGLRAEVSLDSTKSADVDRVLQVKGTPWRGCYRRNPVNSVCTTYGEILSTEIQIRYGQERKLQKLEIVAYRETWVSDDGKAKSSGDGAIFVHTANANRFMTLDRFFVMGLSGEIEQSLQAGVDIVLRGSARLGGLATLSVTDGWPASSGDVKKNEKWESVGMLTHEASFGAQLEYYHRFYARADFQGMIGAFGNRTDAFSAEGALGVKLGKYVEIEVISRHEYDSVQRIDEGDHSTGFVDKSKSSDFLGLGALIRW